MLTTVTVWLLWMGGWSYNNVTVPAIATEAECKQLAHAMRAGSDYQCIPYLTNGTVRRHTP